MDLLAANYKEVLNEHKSSRSKASEIENAIRHHIKISIDEDPEYYKQLSERLNDIIQKHQEKWDELVQLLLDLRDNVESDRQQQATDLGLNLTEQAFFNILIAEMGGTESVDAAKAQTVKDVVQSLVQMLDEASQIVDFFNKWDETRRVRRDIKRVVIQHFDESLVKPVTERFMELAQVKFR